MSNYNLKKEDLIKNLNNKLGYSSNYSKKLINDLIDILITNVITGKLILKNLGTFKLINKSERIGRNPKTKEEFKITARKTISFVVSKDILKHLN